VLALLLEIVCERETERLAVALAGTAAALASAAAWVIVEM
jgi:hypothetical protein